MQGGWGGGGVYSFFRSYKSFKGSQIVPIQVTMCDSFGLIYLILSELRKSFFSLLSDCHYYIFCNGQGRFMIYHSYLQSVTKYLRLTLVFMKNRAPLEKFNCYFVGLLAGRLGTRLSFYEV